MTVTIAMAATDAGSAKQYDIVTAVLEQTWTDTDGDVVVPSIAVVIAGCDRPGVVVVGDVVPVACVLEKARDELQDGGSPPVPNAAQCVRGPRRLSQRAVSAIPVRDEPPRLLQLGALHGCRRRRACAAQLVLVAAAVAHPVRAAELERLLALRARNLLSAGCCLCALWCAPSARARQGSGGRSPRRRPSRARHSCTGRPRSLA